jgi:5-methyltetrahydrofolate--homocysteine methyltransferase
VPLRQDRSVLMVGERTNANGSRAFREALIDGRWDDVVGIARTAAREGAHMIDVCVDYVGRDGPADMREVASRYATASTLPVMIDSTEPAVLEAGLECLGGRSVVNSVTLEDGDGPASRIATVMPIVREHGAAVVALCIDEDGQARTAAWKVRVAHQLITYLTGRWGMRPSDILIDALTFTLATGQEDSRGDGAATIAAIREIKRRHPAVQTILGLSNISFGLAPAARVVLNSVFLAECVEAGLDAAIVHASKILPMVRIPADQRTAALDLIYDRRRAGYDPLTRFLELFAGGDGAGGGDGPDRAAVLAALPLDERLERRIVDGDRVGLEADLDAAMRSRDPLAIINDTLLNGMKTVGDLFGAGQMQLPFVLASAEVMKAAVAHLEPHMERTGARGKGTLVLATVKGDVHDIGKNLVDIILSNNGYTVVNLGIKQPITAILDAAAAHHADAIGMSGLLVKSTVVMKDNLAEMNARGVAATWPVLLGGAALTRTYVEEDLAQLYDGDVRYARDAFEGLSLMDTIMAAKRGATAPLAADPGPAQRRARRERTRRIQTARAAARAGAPTPEPPARSAVATDNPVPVPPFWGNRIIRGVPLADYAAFLDERATFLGQWGLRGARGGGGPSYEELVETEGRPRLRMWLDRIVAERMLDPAVVYGYFPCVSTGETLIVLSGDGGERARFTFPRQRRDRRLCLADFYRPEESGQVDVVPFMVVTMGRRISAATAALFTAGSYRDYLELHGLSVQLTEALTEYWHQRIRMELTLTDGTSAADDDADELAAVLRQGYRGSRYSFGYPACPDLEQQSGVFDLLDPGRAGVELSEEFQLVPEQSTSAIIAHHPDAKYFAT